MKGKDAMVFRTEDGIVVPGRPRRTRPSLPPIERRWLGYGASWRRPGGPLTGKTGVGVIAWLVSWIVLHTLWKDEDVALVRVLVVTLVLLPLGLLLAFPPVFEAFE